LRGDIIVQDGKEERIRQITAAIVFIGPSVYQPTTNPECEGYTGMIVKFMLRRCMRNCKAIKQKRD
jgi:hypothetical protein